MKTREGLHSRRPFDLDLDGDLAMTEPQVKWTARVEETFNKLRYADRDAQELACKSIQEEFGSEEAGAKLRELFEAEHVKVRKLVDKANAVVAKLPEPKPESWRMKSAVKADAEAFFKNPEVQPSVEKPKSSEPKPIPKLRRLAPVKPDSKACCDCDANSG
jgi:hypothetical protein